MIVAKAYCKLFMEETKEYKVNTVEISQLLLNNLTEEKILDLPMQYQKMAIDIYTEISRLGQV